MTLEISFRNHSHLAHPAVKHRMHMGSVGESGSPMENLLGRSARLAPPVLAWFSSTGRVVELTVKVCKKVLYFQNENC